MASFVESATLALVDKTTGNVNKINKSLDNLFRRVKKLQNLADKDIELKFKASTLNRAVSQIDRAQKKWQDFGKTTIEPKIRVNTTDAVNKLAALKRTANASATTTLRINTQAAMAQLEAIRRRAQTSATMPLNARNAATAGTTFANTVQGRASGWGKAFAGYVGHELGLLLRRTISAGGRTAGHGIMSLSDANLALEMAVGNRPNSGALMDTIRKAALDLSTGQYKGVSQAGLIELGAEAVSGLENIDPASIRGMMELSARNAAMLGALEKDAAAGNEQARILNKINTQLNVASDPEKARAYDDAIIAQRSASGADFTMQQIANMLQQLPPALKKVMTPEAVARLGNIREEGGRQSTADVRSAFNDLLRNNLSKADKIAMASQGIEIQSEDDKRATARFLGLRKGDLTAQNAIVEAAGRDPVEFALKSIMPLLQRKGVDVNSYGAMQNFLDAEAGFTTSGAKFWADIIGSREQIAIGDRGRRGAKPEAALERDASLRQSMNRFEQQFQNVAARATESIIPFANEAMQTMTDVLARQAKGEQLSATDWAALATGATTAGIGAGVMGLSDPATRPLALAGLALTGSATALSGAAAALTTAALAQGATSLPGGTKGGKLLGLATKATGALTVASLIADADAYNKKTGTQDGMKNAILDAIASVVVAGKDADAWKIHNAEKTINGLPFTELPPMNSAEMRDAGMYDALTGAKTAATSIAESTTTILSGGATLSDGIISGAQTAAGIIAAAIAGAASQIRITATTAAVAATPALDTGPTTLGPR